jgi:alpha-beta hydrolase superfamily lysophospholipase
MHTHHASRFAAVDGASLFYQAWIPEAARANVVLVHGYAEHSGRYRHVAAALAARGYAVWALDQRGHGHSDGRRAHIARFQTFLDDLDAFMHLVGEQSAGGRPFLLGHSMGGLVATLYTIDHQPTVAGLILSGPAFKIDNGASPLLLAAARWLSAVAPILPVQALDPTLVSRDPQVVDAYRSDPLVYQGKLRARLGYEFVQATHSARTHAFRLTLPLLIALGDADRIAYPQGGQEVFDAARSADKTMQRYPGAYHEILNEPEQEQVIALIADWLDAHTCNKP